MFKVVKEPAAEVAGKIVGTISLFPYAPIVPILKVGEPTTTIVGEVDDDVSACCEGTEVALSALLLTMLSPPLNPL